MRRWYVIGLVVILLLCFSRAGCRLLLQNFFWSGVEKAMAKCVELGYPRDRLVYVNHDLSGNLLGRSEASVSFVVKGSKPRKLVHVTLRRSSCLAEWTVTGSEEQELPEDELEKDK